MFDFENAFDPEHYLYFYESILTSERLEAELNFLTQYTVLDRPMKILDMACGYGRHANELAKRGHAVTGLDESPKFLEAAVHSAQKMGVQVEYVQGDMRKELYVEAFDRVFVLFNALGYFNDTENEQIFRNLYRALKPGGILCFDSYNRDTTQLYHEPYSVFEKNGNLMIDKNTYDTLTGRNWTRRTILKDQKIRTFEYSVRFYNPTEISTLFKRMGFSSWNFYGDWDGSQPKQSKRMIVVAKK